MGFQSPAQDYVQRRLTVNDLVVHNPASTLVIGHDDGLLVIDRDARIAAGDKVALLHDGAALIARTGECCVITEDGQCITGAELESVVVLGKITYEIVSVWHDGRPI
ncbi:MAG TPA: hypothetical protein DCE46_10535 [Pantoea sp.]|nr:hypothetical protein [Pantoea sp.]